MVEVVGVVVVEVVVVVGVVVVVVVGVVVEVVVLVIGVVVVVVVEYFPAPSFSSHKLHVLLQMTFIRDLLI